MNNISREDYDTVVAGLATQVNPESEDAIAKQALLKSAAELIDQLLGDLQAVREKQEHAEYSVEQFADKIVSQAMEIAMLRHELESTASQRDAKPARNRSRKR
jgi:hypothetical protein